MQKRYGLIASAGLLACTAVTNADISVVSSHKPYVDSPRMQLVRSCVEAVRDHWGDAGLVLNKQARHGYTEDGMRLISVGGTVWQDGERVEVFHQCSVKEGSNQLALYVETENQVADATKLDS